MTQIILGLRNSVYVSVYVFKNERNAIMSCSFCIFIKGRTSVKVLRFKQFVSILLQPYVYHVTVIMQCIVHWLSLKVLFYPLTDLSVGAVEEAGRVEVALALEAAQAVLVEQAGLGNDLLSLEHLDKTRRERRRNRTRIERGRHFVFI